MGAIFSLIGGFRGLAIIFIIAALGGWLALQKHNVTKANAERDAAIVQRDEAGIQRDKAIETARINERAITALEEEKKLVNQALNTLHQNQVTSRAHSSERNILIQNQNGTSESRAITAPIISDIIQNIQDDRIIRRGGSINKSQIKE